MEKPGTASGGGKSTLVRMYCQGEDAEFFDLEDPADEARLRNPKLVLERLTGLVVIDEIQLRPDLFPILRTDGATPLSQSWSGIRDPTPAVRYGVL